MRHILGQQPLATLELSEAEEAFLQRVGRRVRLIAMIVQ